MKDAIEPDPGAGEVARICSDFQARWDSGNAIAVEDYLGDSKIEVRDNKALVIRLIQSEIELRRRQAESPKLEEYTSRFENLDEDVIGEILRLPAAPPPEYHGPLLPHRYQSVKEIGRGGIGSVWRVHDKTLDRPLAAKVLHDRYRSDSAANARLDREAKLTGLLQHPGIPPIHDHGQLVSGSSFFVMKLVDGQTLAEILKRDEEGHRSQLLGIFEQVAQTVAYAHSQKIIHRDLKPQNIMVGQFGEVQIMDWGMAKQLNAGEPTSPEPETAAARIPDQITRAETLERTGDSSLATPQRNLTRQGDVFGTPAYMSPEQARGDLEAISESSDVFSLGAILLEILTGKPLYDEVPSELLMEAVAAAETKASLERLEQTDADSELKKICRECLDTERKNRPPTAGVVADQIRNYLESVENRLRATELSRSRAEVKVVEERKRKRLAFVLMFFILAAVSVGCLSAFWYQQERNRQRVANERARAKTLVASTGVAPMEALPFAIESLRPTRQYAIEFLQTEQENGAANGQRMLRYSIALASLGEPQDDYLIERIKDVRPQDLSHVAQALASRPEVAGKVQQAFQEQTQPEAKARYALTALYLGAPQILVNWLNDATQIEERAVFIHLVSSWQGEIDPLLKYGAGELEANTRYALLSGVAEIPAEQILSKEVDHWAPRLYELCKTAPRASHRSVAELILRRWKRELPPPTDDGQPARDRDWYVNSAEMVMVRVSDDAPAQLGSGGYQFYISDREVSAKQFRMFVEEDTASAKRVRTIAAGDNNQSQAGKPYRDFAIQHLERNRIGGDESITPVRNIGYYCALRFCNWLSSREGLEPFYIDQSPPEIQSTYCGGGRLEKWTTNPLANGYRLPDYWEFRKALKPFDFAGFVSAPPRYHHHFAWYLKNASDPQPIATRLPNILGLFDLAGNLSEMTHFRRELDHQHSVVGGSFRSKDIRDLPVGATGSPAVHYAPETGFRVIRLEKKDADAKHVRHLGASFADWVKRSGSSGQSRSKIEAMEKVNEIGLELFMAGELDRAKNAFEFTQSLASKMIKAKTSVEMSGIHGAQAKIQLAEISFINGNHDVAIRQLDSARSFLNQGAARAARNRQNGHQLEGLSQKCAEVRSRVEIERSYQMATHWNPAKRRPRMAINPAIQAIEFLGEKESDHLTMYAAILAADGRFEEAVRVQQKALGLIDRQSETRREQEIRLELYRNSKAFVRPNPAAK